MDTVLRVLLPIPGNTGRRHTLTMIMFYYYML